MHRLARLAVARPRVVLLCIAALTGAMSAGVLRVRTEFGFRVLLGSAHPSIASLESFIDQFGGGLPIQIAWRCGDGHPCETALDETSLEMADRITAALAPVAGIRELRGPSNAGVLVPQSEGFAVRRFVENGRVVPDRDDLERYALQDPLWVGNFVSADARVAAIILQTVDLRNETDLQVVSAIEAATAPFIEEGFEFHIVGNAFSAVIAGRELADSMAKIIPLTLVVIGGTLLLLMRSWRATLFALLVIGTSLVWSFGILGWLDWPRDAILEILASLILVVGVCDAIHVLSRYAAEASAQGRSTTYELRSKAILTATADVGPPCAVTSITTAFALLSFATSDLATFVRFGVVSAAAVMLCLLLTFSMLPALVVLGGAVSGSERSGSYAWDSALSAVLRASERRAPQVLLFAATLLAVCGYGWWRYLEVDTFWYELIGEQTQSVKSIHYLEKNLRPSASLEMQVVLPADTELVDPGTMKIVDRLAAHAAAIEGLGRTRSLLDLVSRLNRLLHDDDPQFEKWADSAQGNAEVIELIGFEDPELLASWVTLDRSQLRLSTEAAEMSNARRGAVLNSVRRFIQEQLPERWKVRLTGGLAVNYDWVHDIQATQLRSFPTAFVAVFIVVAVFLRSGWAAVAAMVPALLPVVITLGTMGWAGLSLDVGRAMIAAILIGIAVDDSVHLLTQYKMKVRQGFGAHEAIREAILHAGRAVVITSVSLSLGFLTLMASAWQTISSFGFFVALAILGALVASVLVLPALIFIFAGNKS